MKIIFLEEIASKYKEIPGNPNLVSEDELEKLRKSLIKFGWARSITINEKTGHIMQSDRINMEIRCLKKNPGKN